MTRFDVSTTHTGFDRNNSVVPLRDRPDLFSLPPQLPSATPYRELRQSKTANARHPARGI
jgi:hypothetical protein